MWVWVGGWVGWGGDLVEGGGGGGGDGVPADEV